MISVVLATFNEEKNIKKCLESVKKFADEIIIADGSSTDKTVKIARDLGAKVINTTNKLNFHVNKQLAMDKAKGDLVLQMDADEIVDPQLAEFIIKIHSQVKRIKNERQAPKAWWIRRKNYFLAAKLVHHLQERVCTCNVNVIVIYRIFHTLPDSL